MKTNSASKYILQVSVFLLITFPVAAAQSVLIQSASDDAWGDPVSGVQLHLAVSKNPPSYLPSQLPGDLPHLEMQIRNTGTDAVTFSCHVGQTSEIEIDGVWYEPGGFFETGTCAAPPALVPGNQSMSILFALQFLLVNGKSLAFDGFHVGAGKHVVRLRTSGKSFGVEDSAHKVITLVSNAITVEIPNLSPTAESILKSLPAHIPELALADIRTHGNDVSAFYIPANEPNDGRTPNLMLISISSYDSEEEAQRGLEKGVFLVQVAPSQKETIKGVTVYKYNEYGPHRIYFQIGRSVIDISALKPPAEPMIMRVFDSLVQELGTN